MNRNFYSVLIADDSDSDRFFLRKAIEIAALRLRVIGEVWNGQEAIAYLSGADRYADRRQHPLPDVLLLDVRMPLLDGLEVLKWLQTHPVPGLKVAMLADSCEMDWEAKARELGADFFFSKHQSSSELMVVAKTLQLALESGCKPIDKPTRASAKSF
jgi:CheY-like chemotaxis protein